MTAVRRSDIELRVVALGDEQFLRRLYASSRAGELAVVGWQPEQLEAFLEMQYSARERHYRKQFPDADDLLVLVGGQPAGRLCVNRGNQELRVVDIALLPEHRGSGIGGALIAGLQEEATTAGLPLALQVEAGNPAANLYRRLGFVSDAADGVYNSMRWTPEPVGAGTGR
ncbi:MAG TPA: GNAT family N-acetyltransferase [Candidatus Dormibacteraeota bacterium]|jgi:GNAT superfamily N-acetyltransferase